MTTGKVIVTTDTADLEQAPKSTTDAILANVKTSVLLKAGQHVAKDEFWDAVGKSEVRQFNRERAEQHHEQARYKASRSATDLKTVLEQRFAAGQGVVTLSASMTDEQILTLIKGACTWCKGKAFQVITTDTADLKASRVMVDEAHRAPQFTAEALQTVIDTRTQN